MRLWLDDFSLVFEIIIIRILGYFDFLLKTFLNPVGDLSSYHIYKKDGREVKNKTHIDQASLDQIKRDGSAIMMVYNLQQEKGRKSKSHGEDDRLTVLYM